MAALKKNQKIWLIIVLSLGGLLLFVVLAINPLLKNLLAARVEQKLVGNFYYHYDHLSVDLLKRSVVLHNISWRFPKDTTVFKHSGNINRFSISGVSLRSLFQDKRFSVREIRFDSLTVINRIEYPGNDKSKPGLDQQIEHFNFYDLIKGQMKSLEVGRIRIVNGEAVWLNPETSAIWRKLDEVQFDIQRIELDSAIAATHSGWFSLGQATLEGKNGELFLPDSLHKIRLEKLAIDYHQKTIKIDSLAVIPLVSKSQMPHVKRYATTRLSITIPQVLMTGVDMEGLMIMDKLNISNIFLDRMNLEAFRDKNPPIPAHLYKELPQVILKNAPQIIKVDSVLIVDSYIRYEEQSELTLKRGVVFFSDVNATLLNITNDSLSLLNNDLAKMNVRANLMGKGKLDADFTFNLKSNNGDHWISGSISKFDLTELNTAFVPLKAFSVRSGYADEMQFDIRLNNYVADGKITFLYSDLKVDKLNEKDLKNRQLDNIFKSFLANTFLVKTSNPSGKNAPRIGVVHHRREQNKSIFNFWLKAILDGVKPTIMDTKK